MSHPPILETRHLHWPDEAACAAWAEQLAGQPPIRAALIELQGPLGAGKTTFARHLLRALGVAGRIKSPTYALAELYDVTLNGAPLAIAHCDFYRFARADEWEDAGLRDLFAAPGLKLVEWPEKAAGHLPAPDLRIGIDPVGDTARDVTLQACSARGQELLA